MMVLEFEKFSFLLPFLPLASSKQVLSESFGSLIASTCFNFGSDKGVVPFGFSAMLLIATSSNKNYMRDSGFANARHSRGFYDG